MSARPALLHGERGSVLSLVLVFGIIAFATVSVYVFGQAMTARAGLARPAELQARLNARSGVYRALDLLAGRGKTDTLKTVSARDSAFNAFLFVDANSAAGIVDTLLALGAEPASLDPAGDSARFGTALVSRNLAGASFELVSTGVFSGRRSRVRAACGGALALKPDTLLYTDARPEPFAWARGAFGASDVDLVKLKEIVDAFRRTFADSGFGLGQMPVTVTRVSDLANVGLRISGLLHIDGAFGGLEWRQRREVIVDGDLQISGECFIEGPRFIVNGNVRLSGRARLKDVSVVAGGKVILDDAVTFAGDILSLTSITVTSSCEVTDKSILAAVPGGGKARGVIRLATGTAAARIDTSYAVTVWERARVDGTVAGIGPTAHVRIGQNATVRGAVYTEGILCNLGLIEGVAKARRLLDCSSGATLTSPVNYPGRHTIFAQAVAYRWPVFMGRMKIVQWIEEATGE